MMLEHMLSGISERLERLWNVMFDGRGDRGVWEEKAATAELLMNYLRANVDVLKKLGDGGRGKVDDGILGILFNRGYSDEAIASFFGVSRYAVAKHRCMLNLRSDFEVKRDLEGKGVLFWRQRTLRVGIATKVARIVPIGVVKG
ncbi:MAG: hypothetical protein QXE78_08650 [Nitrososphaeria archaeon]